LQLILDYDGIGFTVGVAVGLILGVLVIGDMESIRDALSEFFNRVVTLFPDHERGVVQTVPGVLTDLRSTRDVRRKKKSSIRKFPQKKNMDTGAHEPLAGDNHTILHTATVGREMCRR
jgi:hypothetical protein